MSVSPRPHRAKFIALVGAVFVASLAVATPLTVASAVPVGARSDVTSRGAAVDRSAIDVAPADTPLPGAVTSLVATPSTKGAVVSWTPSTVVTGVTTTYTVTSSPGGSTCVSTSTSCAFTTLTPGVTYTFTVVPSNTQGSGPTTGPSDPIQVNTWTSLQTITSVFTNGLQVYSSGAMTFTGISCWAKGQCVGAGSYFDASGAAQAFVDVQTNGTWGEATEIPGSGALNIGATSSNLGAAVNSVGCATANNCAIGGSYVDKNGVQQPFVELDVNGRFATMQEVPGTAALNVGATASDGGGFVSSLACQASGGCFAVGGYVSAAGLYESFVTSEKSGKWSPAVEIPGSAALNVGASPSNAGSLATSVACPSTGSCVSGGYYTDASGTSQAFVDTESAGAWAAAVPLAGVAALNVGGSTSNNGAQVNSLSCSSSGNCAAGGYYFDAAAAQQAFVASEVAGVWNGVAAPGVAALNAGAASSNAGAQASKVSCVASGSCVAVGTYLDAAQSSHVFVTTSSGSTWHVATTLQVGGVAAGVAGPVALSCSSEGTCSVAGVIALTSTTSASGVAQEVNGQWGLFEPIGAVQAIDTLNAGQATAVSCSSDGGCAVVGYFDDGYLVGTYSTSLATPPSAPSNVHVATASAAGHLVVYWTAPSVNGGSAVTGYVASASPGSASCTSSGLTCTITGLSPSSAYRITVVARSANGVGSASAPSSPALYPQSSSKPRLVVVSKGAKVGTAFSMLVVGVSTYRAVTMSLTKGTTTSCNSGPWGQCVIRVTAHARGALRATLRDGHRILTTRLIKVT